MGSVNKVEVVIGGEIITLVSGEHEEYMHKIAWYIDKKLEAIKQTKSGATLNEHTHTLLLAVNIADDYFKTLDQLQLLSSDHHRYVMEMGRLQEENTLLTERIHDLQDRLNASRAELEEYIANFDQQANVVSINPCAANGFG